MFIEKRPALSRWRRVPAALAALYLLTLPPVVARAQEASQLATAFVKVDTGLTLQYVAQGDPRGPVVVLLHGAGDSWHSWDLALPLLPKSTRVYSLTMRGHGLSDHPKEGYARADFAADITSFLKKMDLRDVTLVGHSLGSLVAQVVTQNDAEGRITRLVLIGSGPGRAPDPDKPSELSAYFASVKDPISYEFARDFQAGTSAIPLPPQFLETMIGEVQRVPAAMFHALAKSDADPQHVEKLRRIRAKTLLLWGDQDAMFSRADQDALLGIIPGSKLVAYPGTGHALHWEQPAKFVRDLVAFMAPAKAR